MHKEAEGQRHDPLQTFAIPEKSYYKSTALREPKTLIPHILSAHETTTAMDHLRSIMASLGHRQSRNPISFSLGVRLSIGARPIPGGAIGVFQTRIPSVDWELKPFQNARDRFQWRFPDMNLNSFVFLFLLFPLIAPASGAEPGAARRPNILFIMTDDHAAHAISSYGSAVNKTPHLDRIAQEGMRFEQCFVVNSICTPSRAAILTGKYSHLNGVPVFNRFDGSQPTVAKYLQAAGYHTGMVGKWHLGSDPTGFDHWIILPGQGLYFDPAFITSEGRRVIKGYVSDVITDLAVDFLKNRPKEKPFFLMCHHKAPHRPWEPDEKHKAMFAGKEIPEPQTLRDDYATRTEAIGESRQKVFEDMTRRDLKLEPPADLRGQERNRWLQTKPAEVEIQVNGQKKKLTGEELNRWKYQRYMQDYLACVQSVDDNVGRLMGWLEANGLRENTIVIYTSDQGFFLGDHGLYDKRFMYEPSLRMPFIVRWPGVIQAGSVQGSMIINCDFAPTFMDAAGLPVPADMQGRSLIPLLKGQQPTDWRTSMYYRYYHDPGDHNTRAHYGVRTRTHKLIYFWKKDQWELYDLIKDPNEMKNLYNNPAQAGIAAKMKQELFRLKREFKDDDQFALEQPAAGVDGQLPRSNPQQPAKR
jgi:arylsulfatase A-like enzyme